MWRRAESLWRKTFYRKRKNNSIVIKQSVKIFAEMSPGSKFCSVFENDDEHAVEHRLKFFNLFCVDNYRAVNPQKIVWIEPHFQIADFFSDEMRFMCRVNFDVIIGGFKPTDFFYVHKENAPRVFNDDSFQII